MYHADTFTNVMYVVQNYRITEYFYIKQSIRIKQAPDRIEKLSTFDSICKSSNLSIQKIDNFCTALVTQG